MNNITTRLIAGGLTLLGLSSATAQTYLTGAKASEKIQYAEWIQMEDYTSVPTFIRYGENAHIPVTYFPTYAQKAFQLGEEYGWNIQNATTDELGFFHQRLTQTYKGYPVEGAVFLVHAKGGEIRMLNGDMFNDLNLDVTTNITEKQAFDAALSNIGASEYIWQQADIRKSLTHANLAEKPKGELVIAARDGGFFQKDFHLAYKFDVYATKPLSRHYIYVDAKTGEIISKQNRIHTADVNGTAITVYSGSRPIVADSYTGGYRLREVGRGGGIRTLNMQTGTNTGAAVDFTDADNNWNNVNANQDEYATDAHWGSEMVYDFYNNSFNRNGIDGTGGTIYCYVHYDVNYFNAFWDGATMNIGDGSSGATPLTALDIIAHEMTHGVTQYTAGLVYQDEPGGLNESFSDVLGTAAELTAKPNGSWDIGSEIGVTLRSMSDPKQYQNPDTYLGQYWVAAGGPDNGGVHTNSGVQNYWFYLIVMGGSGTNDNNQAYNVTGLGLVKGSAIAYRNLSVYLTPNSEYIDARTGAIQATADLYGACTPEVITVTNAWYGVGVGAQFVQAVTADFVSPQTTGCAVPFTVQFNNQSSNGGTYSWNFGDGGTSTLANPSHTYTSFGTYSVYLSADGGACGTNNITKPAFVNIDANNPCIVVMQPTTTNQTQSTCSGILFDNGGTSNYTDNVTSTITIAPTGASSVTLDFQSFALEDNYDYLYIYDGPTINSPLIGTYTGIGLNNLPNGGVITSTSGAVTLRHTADQAVNESGFEINWSCALPTAPPSSNFEASATNSCNGTIDFQDLSTQGPVTWAWDFGDGGTSNLQNPSHTYTTNGTYTVTLTTTNANGNDAEVKSNYVTINMPAAPTVAASTVTVQSGQTANLSVTSNGTITWYDNTQTAVGTGTSYTTPPITANTVYYAQTTITQPTVSGGPADNTIANAGVPGAPAHYLIFDVNQACTLKSVKVYAQGAGNRVIQHRDDIGNVISQLAVNLPDGMSVVTLDFPLTPGLNYQLGVDASIQNVNLLRNNGGANFPYAVGTYADITGTDVTTQPTYYYYFYDWKIEPEPCLSVQAPVNVVLGTESIANELSNGTLALYPNPGNGVFKVVIENNQAADMQVRIFNAVGQLVQSSEMVKATLWEKSMNLEGQAKGTYFVQIKVGEQVVYKKYMLQ